MPIRSYYPPPSTLPISTLRIDGTWTSLMIEFAAVIGPYATLTLCDELGGQHLDVPSSPHQASSLVRAIGRDAANKFAEYYGLTRQYIPVADSALIRARAQPFLRLIEHGKLSVADASMRLGLQRNTISLMLTGRDIGNRPPPPRRPRPAGQQFDLLVSSS